MYKICVLLTVLVFLTLVTSCGNANQKAVQSEQPSASVSEVPTSTMIATPSQASSSTPTAKSQVSADTPKETEFSVGDTSDDTPLEWPSELMGDILPVPKGTITSIDKANQIWGKDAPDYIIVVSLKDMSRDDCVMYVNKLKNLGFSDGVETNIDVKIEFSGSLNDAGVGVSFSHNFIDNKGFVSYNPKINAK